MKNVVKAVFLGTLLALLVGVPVTADAQAGVQCATSVQAPRIGEHVGFVAVGGSGTYYWSASNASPAIGTGQSFMTQFNVTGTQIVVVTSNGQNSQCVVQVQGGSVLGVSTIPTGPADTALWALAIGLAGAVIATAVISRKRLLDLV